MTKSRICPHCGEPVPLDSGFHFDENLNLIHDECGRIMFSTTSNHDGVTNDFRNPHRGYNGAAHSPLLPTTRQGYNKFDIDT
jgi:hypothetical protein